MRKLQTVEAQQAKRYLSLMEEHMEESSNNHKEQLGNMPV